MVGRRRARRRVPRAAAAGRGGVRPGRVPLPDRRRARGRLVVPPRPARELRRRRGDLAADRPRRRARGARRAVARRASGSSPGSWWCSAGTPAGATTLRGLPAARRSTAAGGDTRPCSTTYDAWRAALGRPRRCSLDDTRRRTSLRGALRRGSLATPTWRWVGSAARPRVLRAWPTPARDRRRALRPAACPSSPRPGTRGPRSSRAPTLAAAGEGAEEAVDGGLGGQPAGPPRDRAGRAGAHRRRGAARGAGAACRATSCARSPASGAS